MREIQLNFKSLFKKKKILLSFSVAHRTVARESFDASSERREFELFGDSRIFIWMREHKRL